jgi:hypothetical protein
VAAGTYVPTSLQTPNEPLVPATALAAGDDNPLNLTFLMKAGVALFGGFAGTETALDQRDWKANETILSGERGNPGVEDNCLHVVWGADDAIIDGFTITGGEASSFVTPPQHLVPEMIVTTGEVVPWAGGGILAYKCAPLIRNCHITGNRAMKGGAIYIMVQQVQTDQTARVSPTIYNCTFTDNYSSARGGAIQLDNRMQDTILANCVFADNLSESKGGAVYFDFGATATVINSLFYENWARRGAAVGHDGGGSQTFINCTFSQNVAYDNGAAVYMGSGGAKTLNATNCIFWGNKLETIGNTDIYTWFDTNKAVVSNSIIEQSYWPYGGEGISHEDPTFVSAASQDFHLKTGSPAIDAGATTGAPVYDLDGVLRDATPDIGVFEFVK